MEDRVLLKRFASTGAVILTILLSTTRLSAQIDSAGNVWQLGYIDSQGYGVLSADPVDISAGLEEMYPGWDFDDSSYHIIGNAYVGKFYLTGLAHTSDTGLAMHIALELPAAVEQGTGDTILATGAPVWRLIKCVGTCPGQCRPHYSQPNGHVDRCTACLPDMNGKVGTCQEVWAEVENEPDGFWGPLVKIAVFVASFL